MGFIERDYKVDIMHIGTSNLITNYGILCLLEDIATVHSDIAGYGIVQIPFTHVSWILLNWKVSVFKRVAFGDMVKVKTWSVPYNELFTYRNFEIYDNDNNLICIASSKWTLVNSDTKTLTKITKEIELSYEPEDKLVFDKIEIAKLKEPSNVEHTFSFNVLRRDIDFNNHMHNLYYLLYSYEALPKEVYEKGELDNFEIMYKNGSMLGEKIDCYYSYENNAHYVVMKTDNKLHAIIKLY